MLVENVPVAVGVAVPSCWPVGAHESVTLWVRDHSPPLTATTVPAGPLSGSRAFR